MQINGTAGNDNLIGTDEDDFINPGGGSDTVAAGNGNDYILVGGSGDGGSDTVDGGDGYDVASYDFGGETAGVTFTSSGSGPATRTQVDPLGGVDTLTNIEEVHIFGGSGNDVLTGDAGNNFIAGNGGDDTLVGGDGNDFLQGGAGNDTLDGGANGPFVDTADYSNSTAGVNVNLAAGTASDGLGGTDTLIGIEGVNGTAFADSLIGNDSGNWFRPGAGNDTVEGGVGLDVVFYEDSLAGVVVNLQTGSASGAGIGTDSLSSIEAVHGSYYDDQLTLGGGGGYVFGRAGNDVLTGGSGDDNFIGGSGNDTIHGGLGFDNLSYTEDGFDGGLLPLTGIGVTVNLTAGTATDNWGTTDTFDGIEGVQGSAFNDALTGDALSNFINGGNGDDSIFGLDGNDNLQGGLGNDTLDGGNGVDNVSYFQAAGAVTVNLTSGTASGADGTDSLSNIENINGSAFNDILTGDALSNFIDGGNGDDSISGLDGNDNLAGGSGNDTLLGGDGMDFLQGGDGNDSLSGGNGNDSLQGGDGNDSLSGGNGDDSLHGGAGDDTLDGGANGPFVDTVDYSDAAAGVNVNLVTGTASDGFGGTDVLIGIEGINGSQFADTLVGNAVGNWFRPGAGNDTVAGGGGSDVVFYEDSSAGVVVNLQLGVASGAAIGVDALSSIEAIHGSHYDDQLTLSSAAGGGGYVFGRAGNDTLTGGSGDDNFIAGSGNDTIHGGAGFDSLSYAEDSFDGGVLAPTGLGVTVNLATGTATDNWGNTDTFTGIELVNGSRFADQLIGGNPLNGSGATDGFEGFTGDAGNDFIDGGAGYDRANYNSSPTGVTVVLGGTSAGTAQDGWGGTDTLLNIEEVRGSEFADALTGSDSGVFESFIGRAGNDVIDGKGGVDRADYRDDPSAVTVNLLTGIAQDGFGYTDTLAGIEQVRGSAFNDVITGDAGNNNIDGLAGNDVMLGGAGRDNFVGGAGNDSIDGGAILDRVNYADLNSVSYASSTSGVNVNLASGAAQDGLGGTDTLANINFVTGSSFNDTFLGSSDANLFEQFEGGLGNDIINGGALDTVLQRNSNRVNYSTASGSVTVNLAAGTATGAAGNDTLININHATGSSFADTLTGSNSQITEQFEGRGGNDLIDGAGGIDLVRYDSATAAVNVNLATGIATDGLGGTDTLLNIEGVRGSSFNDILTGGNTLNGTGAKDGFEAFTGNAGNDTIDGGGGYDRADYLTSTAGVTVTLGGTGIGSAVDGLGGMDTLVSIEGVRGSAFDDILTGSDSGAFESFEGREGNDVIDGRGGIDRVDYQFSVGGVTVNLKSGTAADGHGTTDSLRNIENVRGSAFNDLITGHKGSNTIEGGAGNDRINGGSGVDTAVFSGTQASYTIVKHGNKVTVTGADGIDVLKSIEILQFSDGSLTLKGKGDKGQSNSGNDNADDADDDGDWKDASGNDSWKVGRAGDDDGAGTLDQHRKSGGSGDGEIWNSADVDHSHALMSAGDLNPGHANPWLTSDGTYGA